MKDGLTGWPAARPPPPPDAAGLSSGRVGPAAQGFHVFTGAFLELDLVGLEPGQGCIETPRLTRILHEWNECWLNETQWPPPHPFFRADFTRIRGATPRYGPSPWAMPRARKSPSRISGEALSPLGSQGRAPPAAAQSFESSLASARPAALLWWSPGLSGLAGR
jgi:hypothetical protein